MKRNYEFMKQVSFAREERSLDELKARREFVISIIAILTQNEAEGKITDGEWRSLFSYRLELGYLDDAISKIEAGIYQQ